LQEVSPATLANLMKLEPPNPAPIPKNRALLIGTILAILFAFIATIVTWGVLWSHGHEEAEKTVTPVEAKP
jgi:hypothetical protein